MLKSPLKSMESKPAQFCPDEDRISKLPDDIVIAILEKVDVSTAIRTSTLSTRWRHLPLLLSHICLKTEDFMPQNSTPVSDDKVIDEAMAALVELLTSFVAAPRRERCIRILSLAVHLIPDRLCDIGKLVCDAIDCGKLKSLELEFNTVNGVYDSTELDMRRHAQSLMCFFDSSPRVFCCLTKLYLCNANFRGTDMHRLLTSCEQLQDLTLVECDTGCLGVFKIDVPGSKLRVLRVRLCPFEKVQLSCLPKLVRLHCEYWMCSTCPVSFHYVPCLEEVELVCDATRDHAEFKITELLGNTTNTRLLTLNFQGEKIWIAREGKELQAPFKALRKLFLHGIYVQFDLLWTLVILEAAPSVQIFGIKIWDHTCNELGRRELYSERTIGSLDAIELGGSIACFLHLKKLEFSGFKQVKKHLDFIKAVMDRAPNLETVLLEDKEKCERCEAVDASMFPKNKDEEDMALKQLRVVGHSCPAQIIFQRM